MNKAQALRRAIELNNLYDEITKDRSYPSQGPSLGSVAYLINQYRRSDEWTELKKSTQGAYNEWIDRFRFGFTARGEVFEGFGDLRIDEIGPKVLKTWRRRIDKSVSAYEAYHAVGVMRALWAWAESEEIVEESPASKVKNPRPPKRTVRWTLAQRAAFLQASFDVAMPSLGIAMLVSDNISQSPIDIWSLTRSQFDGEGFHLKGRSKTQVGDGYLRLWTHIAGAVAWQLSRHDGPYVFINDNTRRPYSSDSQRSKHFRQVRAVAALPATLQFQDLRRTGATEAGDAGATAPEIQAQLRHTSLAEASTYLKAGSTMAASAADKRLAKRKELE